MDFLTNLFDPKQFSIAGIMLLAAVGAFFATRWIGIPFIHRLISMKNKQWGDIFRQNRPLYQLSYLVPVSFLTLAIQYFPTYQTYLSRFLSFYITLVTTLIIVKILKTGLEVYRTFPVSQERPIKNYVQLLSMFVYIIGFTIATCALFEKDPWGLVSGIGALTAVIVLVFRDTILSFIAGMQIASNNLIRKGDWIEVPAYGADGAVLDVALHVISVQNWDKTVVTIPTYKVIESGFKNWRGMYDAGGRRIKRSLLIDQTSVSFVNRDLIKSLAKNPHIQKHVSDFITRVEANAKNSDHELWEVTNLAMFRTYIKGYLRSHPKINQDLTFIIRLLDPTATGIPLEIYIFTKTTDWSPYEDIQSELFEHLMAAMQIFGLRLFQSPSYNDIKNFQSTTKIFAK